MLKKEHLEVLLGVAQLYASSAEKELRDAVNDKEFDDYAELEEELVTWTAILQELEVMSKKEVI